MKAKSNIKPNQLESLFTTISSDVKFFRSL